MPRLTKKQRTSIKQEQAAFIEKIAKAEANEHQKAIFAAAETGKGRFVVLAGPGSGKTFSSIKASTSFTGTSIYFSYNKKIQIDTNNKLVAIDSKMTATTAHAFGLSCLMAYSRGQITVDKDEKKYRNLVSEYLLDTWSAFLKENARAIEDDKEANIAVMRMNAEKWSLALVHYAQVSLTAPTPNGLFSLVDDFDLTDINPRSLVWPFVCGIVRYAINEGLNLFKGPEHLVSFDDMIYYPNIVEGVPVRSYDHIIVDEAQDTSRASLELMLKAAHKETQIFFVGDKKQSIYVFAGAAFNSIDQIIERLDAQILPLRIVYRCGSTIVDLANQLCEEDEKLISAGNHTGNVEVLGADFLERLRPGDAVLSRTTARLVQGCLKVLQTGKRAKVLGRNIGDSIAAVVTVLEAMRVSRGKPMLQADLSNLLAVLEAYHRAEAHSLKESRENPELALSELEDKVKTVQAFFEAYIGKCYNEALRVPEDPKCRFDKTAKDFKLYIHGLFSEDDSAKDFILFMTAHRSKGGEWENVYIIGCDEFPHPKAKSDRQKKQEQNLMFVAVTRAIENLYFVNAPFSCLIVPGYDESELIEEQSTALTVVSSPYQQEASIYDVPGFEDYHPDVVAALFEDFLRESTLEHNHVPDASQFDHDENEPINGTFVVEQEPDLLEGRVSHIVAIEVLCPSCGTPCVDRITQSTMIKYDLVGHAVICPECQKSCIVPLNAFNIQGSVIAREKPETGITNSKREKKGRTKKERKSTKGRKAKSGVVREPMQLSLDVRTIQALNLMGINKSQLFEELLQQYEPFLEAYAAIDTDELDHDEIEDNDDDE